MGIIVQTCPHCGAGNASFIAIGGRVAPTHNPQNAALRNCSVGACCPNCNGPIAVVVSTISHMAEHPTTQALNKFLSEQHGPDIAGFKVAHIWPKPPEPSIPDHIPEMINRALLQAERNYHVTGNEEASAMMYRRSLELALKDKFPDLRGSLAARIKELVSKGTLPPSMADWADEIRSLGNDAAHDPSEIDRAQLTMVRGFTDATLRYLYTLPAEIEARRKL